MQRTLRRRHSAQLFVPSRIRFDEALSMLALRLRVQQQLDAQPLCALPIVWSNTLLEIIIGT